MSHGTKTRDLSLEEHLKIADEYSEKGAVSLGAELKVSCFTIYDIVHKFRRNGIEIRKRIKRGPFEQALDILKKRQKMGPIRDMRGGQ